ncbi:MAG: T9SS type B sorting domain-containing protein, partial [Sphingobacteriaceae bacterium]|nr:T9SS type B sorting domain-containing protein [Sphingobacteriaceae bacterium]
PAVTTLSGAVNSTTNESSTSTNFTVKAKDGLSAGTYTCTVTSGTQHKIITVNITQPNKLVINDTKINVSVFGGNDGSVNLTASGGIGGYTYAWLPLGVTGQTTNKITNLVAGTYTCTITSGVQSETRVFKISEPIQVNIAKNEASDYGLSDGSINLTTAGGDGTYIYEWLPIGVAGQGTNMITNLVAGIYTCTITSATESTKVIVEITQPEQLVVSYSQINVSAFGGNDASINLTATGGKGNYTYLWNTNANTPSISNLSAGIYTCTIASGVQSTQVTIKITQPITVTIIKTNVLVNGAATGSIKLITKGGNGKFSYKWSPDTVAGQGTEAIKNLTAGTYVCEIISGTQKHTVTVEITQPPVILVTVVQTNVLVKGEATGEAMVIASGGEGNFTYLWNTGETTPMISNLPVGTYTCIITSGAQSVEQQVVITEGNLMLKPNNNITRENPNWVIKNIENFPTNEVVIYDRYGRKLKRIINYNNDTNNWNGEIDTKKVEQSTYYYVIDLGEGKAKIKGFITVFQE